MNQNLIILVVFIAFCLVCLADIAYKGYKDIKWEKDITARREARLHAQRLAVHAEAVDKVHAAFATNVAEAADKAYALFLEETDPMMRAFNTLAQDC